MIGPYLGPYLGPYIGPYFGPYLAALFCTVGWPILQRAEGQSGGQRLAYAVGGMSEAAVPPLGPWAQRTP